MDHQTHKAGTVQGCNECAGLAYEPGWYAALLSFSQNEVLVDLTRERTASRV